MLPTRPQAQKPHAHPPSASTAQEFHPCLLPYLKTHKPQLHPTVAAKEQVTASSILVEQCELAVQLQQAQVQRVGDLYQPFQLCALP